MMDQVRVLDGRDPSFNPEFNDIVQQLARMEIYMHIGVTPQTRLMMAAAGEEPHIREFCPNDRKRFATDQSASAWIAKHRIPLGAVNPGAGFLINNWLGPEKNDVIPEAPITTAFRTTEAGLSYARSLRQGQYPGFRLGLMAGRLLILTALETGAEPHHLSLETWGSNLRALDVYEELGFELRAKKLDLNGRPTLHDVGDVINGYTVFEHTDPTTGLIENRVFDTRCFYQYAGAAA
jgi:hypothetical protein